MREQDIYVYVFGIRKKNRVSGPVKVGISATPSKRLASMQTGCPDELVLVTTFRFHCRENAKSIEAIFHKLHDKDRRKGEWFNLIPSDAIQYLITYIECMITLNQDVTEQQLQSIMRAVDMYDEAAA